MATRNVMTQVIPKIMHALNDGETLDRFHVKFNNTNSWTVYFPSSTFIDDAPELFNDLEAFAQKSNGKYESKVTMAFHRLSTSQMTILHILLLFFQFRTGHITVGGSICNEILTTSGWRDICPVQLVLIYFIIFWLMEKQESILTRLYYSENIVLKKQNQRLTA